VIRSFGNKQTEQVWKGQRVRAFGAFLEQAERRLGILDAATSLEDLRGLPSNHFEALLGNRLGEYSIRINKQWRLCFRWKNGDAYDAEIVDYH
jgi:proteic killer suppression protein